MDCVILIPVKGFATPKQRLSSVLLPTERSALAQAMLDDLMGVLARWRERPDVAVVTGDALARAMARTWGFEVIKDRDCAGETEAITAATSAVVRQGARSAIVIPADIPLVTAAELSAVLNALTPSSEAGSVLVPAADDRGTNAALRRPADLFPLRFGNDSFQPHLLAARATGHHCAVLKLPGIGLDVDAPADLAALLREPARTESQRLLLSWGLPGRLAAVAPVPVVGAPAVS